MEQTLRISRARSAMILFVGVPALVLMLVVLALGTVGLYLNLTRNDANAFTYLSAPILTAFVAWYAGALIRYRESFLTLFRVTASGIVIENRRYGVLKLPWSEVTRGRYSRFGQFIAIESQKLDRPIALMNFGRTDAAAFGTVRETIRNALPGRWSEGRL